MQYDDIIGQSSAKDTLRSMAKGRTPHALMLLGPRGCGKLALATAYAQHLLCLHPTEAGACGTCAQCRKSIQLLHPDLHFSYPTVGSKATSEQFLPQWREAVLANPYQASHEWLQHIGAENKQGNITKEECVSIIRKLNLKVFEGRYKILILWLPEFLAKEGNRLLKLIEEPPENTLFLLVAENQSLILNTIRSRCQLVNVQPLSDEDVARGLQTQKGIAPERAEQIAFLANGDFNMAQQMATQQDQNYATFFLQWMRDGYQGKPTALVKAAEELASLGREGQKNFLDYALHFLREYALLKAVGDIPVRLQGDALATAQRMTKVLELEQVEALSKLYSDCIFAVLRNAHPKVLFLDAGIQMNRIFQRKSAAAYSGLRPENIL